MAPAGTSRSLSQPGQGPRKPGRKEVPPYGIQSQPRTHRAESGAWCLVQGLWKWERMHFCCSSCSAWVPCYGRPCKPTHWFTCSMAFRAQGHGLSTPEHSGGALAMPGLQPQTLRGSCCWMERMMLRGGPDKGLSHGLGQPRMRKKTSWSFCKMSSHRNGPGRGSGHASPCCFGFCAARGAHARALST